MEVLWVIGSPNKPRSITRTSYVRFLYFTTCHLEKKKMKKVENRIIILDFDRFVKRFTVS